MIRATLTAAAALAAAPALAATAVGLTGDRTLVLFDAARPQVVRTVEVEGVDRLLGIDMRPADGRLYGVAVSGAVLRIDPATGAAETVSVLAQSLPGAAQTVVEFNPAADRLRFMEGLRNLRVNVDDGAVIEDGPLAYVAGDPMAEAAPSIVAASYANSRGRPESTAMYDVDGAARTLVRQAPPNDGALKTIGMLGVGPAAVWAFDIHTAADGTNAGWLSADNRLHRVDLETGAATEVGMIAGAPGPIRDLTFLDAM